MSKKCTPLWREARFEVKMYKAPQLRTTFGSWDVEKVHAVAARSTFRSQKCKKTDRFRALLEVEMSKKSTPLWREAHFEVKILKTPHARTTFGRSDVVSCGRRTGLCTLSKVSKTWGFCVISKNDGRRGAFEEDLQRCIFRVLGAVQETCSSELLGGEGADFLRWVAFWSIRSSGLLRWFCTALRMTRYHFFVVRQVESKNRKTHWYEAISSALNYPFLKDVSQNCFVFDVVNLKKWGCLAELLCFWRCQVQKLRKSHWIAAFLMLSSSKTEEVSQNSFVFKLADRQIDRQRDRQRER